MKVYVNLDYVGTRIANFKPFENFSKKDLQDLRNNVCLNSLYISDYQNKKGIDPEYCCNFFDGYLDYLCELAGSDGITVENQGNGYLEAVYDRYDNINNLVEFHRYYWNFDGVKYSRDIWVDKLCEWVTVNYTAA